MKKIFAFSKVDNSFIVSAEDSGSMATKILEISEKYDKFYKEYVAPGVKLIKAKTLAEARKLL